MKLLLNALRFTAFGLVLLGTSEAFASYCPNGIRCVTIDWNSTTCNDLRVAVVQNQGVIYGSTTYLNNELLETGSNSEKTAFCKSVYGRNFRRGIVLPVSTMDRRFPNACRIHDLSFRCTRARMGHSSVDL